MLGWSSGRWQRLLSWRRAGLPDLSPPVIIIPSLFVCRCCRDGCRGSENVRSVGLPLVHSELKKRFFLPSVAGLGLGEELGGPLFVIREAYHA